MIVFPSIIHLPYLLLMADLLLPAFVHGSPFLPQ